MPNRDYALAMARYNLWQNENLLTATDSLSPEERSKDRGAFFGSIQHSFSHILWADTIWLSRFAGTSPPSGGIPESTMLADDWDDYRKRRQAMDERLLQWAHEVSPDWFEGDLHWYSGAVGRDMSKPKKILVLQLFNHQTHHRGQIHAMLTAAGAKPGDTDIAFMPESYLGM